MSVPRRDLRGGLAAVRKNEKKLMTGSYGRGVRLMAVTFMVACVFYAIFSALPFAPYNPYSYETIPPVSCPNADVVVSVDRSIDTPFLGSIKTSDSASHWETVLPNDELKGDQIDPSEAKSVSIAPSPRKVIVSPVVRSAPASPGRYVLVTELTVWGRVGFVGGRNQVLTLVSDEPVTVLAESDPRCLQATIERSWT